MTGILQRFSCCIGQRARSRSMNGQDPLSSQNGLTARIARSPFNLYFAAKGNFRYRRLKEHKNFLQGLNLIRRVLRRHSVYNAGRNAIALLRAAGVGWAFCRLRHNMSVRLSGGSVRVAHISLCKNQNLCAPTDPPARALPAASHRCAPACRGKCNTLCPGM